MNQADLRGNAILAALPDRELQRLARDLDLVDVAVRDQVYEAGGLIPEVYFPLGAVFSMVGTAEERVVVEVATIGREGMAGLPVFLGATSTPHAAFCQIPGQAAKLSAERFRAALAEDGVLPAALGRFTQATMVQIAQNVVCNSSHHAVQRAARWLLTTGDRVGSDKFQLTQEFLSQMLALRRPTVSETARRLQADGHIRYSRGQMTITDRAALQQTACACYAIVKAEFDQITAGRR